MNEINYDNRFFRSISNSKTGEVSSATGFHYRQKDGVIWATYQAGEIAFGTLVAKILEDGKLEMRYSHVNERGELMTGERVSTPEILGDGKIRLHEKCGWTCGDFASGESIIEEL